MMSLPMTSCAGNDHVSVAVLVQGEIYGAVNGGVDGGGYLPPEFVPSNSYCRETPGFFW